MPKRAAIDQQPLEFTTKKVLWSLHIRPTVSFCIGSLLLQRCSCSFNEKLLPITFNFDAKSSIAAPPRCKVQLTI